MSRPKRDEKTKDTVEVTNRAGNRARVEPGSAAEAYFKARGYKSEDDEAEKPGRHASAEAGTAREPASAHAGSSSAHGGSGEADAGKSALLRGRTPEPEKKAAEKGEK